MSLLLRTISQVRAYGAQLPKIMAGSMQPQVRRMSDKIRDKEKAEEKSYFNRQDEDLLRKLLKKMKETQPNDEKAIIQQEEINKLKTILSPYKVPESVYTELLKWKESH